MKIGIISDTHNYLDPRVLKTFEGVSHILHGGDIGQPSILQELSEIAPVVAVAGNTDDPALGYRLTETLEIGSVRFMLRHIVNPRSLSDAMRERITSTSPDVVVFGHTHKPFDEMIGGIHFLNPGYAGQARFNLSRSIALFHLDDGKMWSEFRAL